MFVKAYRTATIVGNNYHLSFYEPMQFNFLKLVQKIKYLKTPKSWDKVLKVWILPFTEENTLWLQLNKFQIIEVVQDTFDIPDWTPPYLAEPFQATENFKSADKLREYQREFLGFMEWHGGRGLNADEMGTGKTCQALAWAAVNDEWPVLVVTTSSTKLQWRREVKRWIGNGYPVALVQGKTPYDIPSRAKFVVINWDILAAWKATLLEFGFKLIIGDEVHLIGNPEAIRTLAFQELARSIPGLVALTGTPVRTRPSQFWTILNLIAPKTFPDLKPYLQKYCDPKPTPFGMAYSGSTNKRELYSIVRKHMVRRLKKDILTELPDKIRIAIPLPVDNIQEYDLFVKTSFANIEGSRDNTLQALAGLSQSTFNFKKTAIMEWLADFLQSDRKIVLFVWHQAVGDYLAQELGKAAVRIDGKSSREQKDAAIKSFRTNDKVRVVIGNILAAGVGIDGLQDVCNDLAFIELVGSPADISQAEDRLHRMGQKNPVNIYYLFAEGTKDVEILPRLTDRWQDFGIIMDGESQIGEFMDTLKQAIK